MEIRGEGLPTSSESISGSNSGPISGLNSGPSSGPIADHRPNPLGWTPHSGYHGPPRWVGQRFFEGWYSRLTLPELGDSVAFMYAINDPGSPGPRQGGSAQILGLGETPLVKTLPSVAGFWAWRHRWGLGHGTVPLGAIPPDQFWSRIPPDYQGYQHWGDRHQGILRDDKLDLVCRWDYRLSPTACWGPTSGPPRPTAGWLSYLPLFDPGWQVTLAHGWGQGWLEWQGCRHDFDRAPVYQEKNWGQAFPRRWFWLQANHFPQAETLAITVAGAERWGWNRWETVGMIGIHWGGQFYQWASLHDPLHWRVTPWGHWQITAQNHRHWVTVTGTCATPPASVQVPTQAGMEYRCWDTSHGHLTVRVESAMGDPLLTASTDLAGLEVGGDPWPGDWVYG